MPRRAEQSFDPFQSKDFGRGRVVGNDHRLLDLYMNPKTRKKFLRATAWAHACPIPDEVSDEFGVEWTIERYLECNFVWGHILDVAKQHNPQLYEKLSQPMRRRLNEPMGKHEQSRVPKDHTAFMSPLSTVYGYALPRVFLEIAGRGKKRTQERYVYAMESLESAIKDSQEPTELLARLTNAARTNPVVRTKSTTLLNHVLPTGVLTEENSLHLYEEMIQMLQRYAPVVFRAYHRLSPEEKKKMGLADVRSGYQS